MSLQLLLVLASLGVWRITRFIALDDFPLIRRPRQWIVNLGWKRNPTSVNAPWYAELAGCPFCVSFYVAAVMTLLLDRLFGLPLPALCGLGTWGGACFLHAITDGRQP